ncbi:MAG: outer membrane beta-barrel protein [Vicingaceae bacterium]
MKLITTLFLITSTALCGFAQHIIGIEASYKRSTFVYDEASGSPFESAGRIGIGLNYQAYIGEILSSATHVSTGIIYESKGAARLSTLLDENGSAVRDEKVHSVLYYWTLPLMIELHPSSGSFFVEAGGFYSLFTEHYFSEIPLARYQSIESGFKSMTPYQPLLYKSYDAGINIGVGTAIPMSDRTGVKFTFRYSHGLVDVNDDIAYTGALYNRSFSISVAFDWGI